VRGAYFRGLGEGARFTEIAWAKEAFERILGFTPYPGTLNLRLDLKESEGALSLIRSSPGHLMKPPDDSSCAARCYLATIAGHIPGGVVIPMVEGYYQDVLELLAPVNLRETLRLEDGDLVWVEVFLGEKKGTLSD
jgi:riboflavin kinase